MYSTKNGKVFEQHQNVRNLNLKREQQQDSFAGEEAWLWLGWTTEK
jgi:hypothetical protein